MCKKVHRRGELWEYSSIATRRHSGQEKSQKLTKGLGPCLDSHPSCNTIREVIRPHFILQHDSEPTHATRVIKSCLQAQEKHIRIRNFHHMICDNIPVFPHRIRLDLLWWRGREKKDPLTLS